MPTRRMSNRAINARSLHHRLERLESRAASSVAAPEIMVEFVEPNGEFGGRVCDSYRASDLFGRYVWYREHDEMQEAFKQRVWADAKAHLLSGWVMIFWPGRGHVNTSNWRTQSVAWPLAARAQQTASPPSRT
jgi:hypothetical protein